jgi:hypothetical protein
MNDGIKEDPGLPPPATSSHLRVPVKSKYHRAHGRVRVHPRTHAYQIARSLGRLLEENILHYKIPNTGMSMNYSLREYWMKPSIKGPPRPGAGMKDLSIIPITPRMEDHESAAQCLRMIMILPNHLLLEDVLHLRHPLTLPSLLLRQRPV